MTLPTLKHIVVGVGLTETSLEVADEALRIARKHCAKLSFVHVAEEDTQSTRDKFSDHLKTLRLDDQIETEVVVVVGQRVSESIAEFAKNARADLICVGPIAHGFVERHITGGAAEQLISRTETPTLIVRKSPDGAYQKALIALDFSSASARALRLGVALLDPSKPRKVVALHVLSQRSGAHRLASKNLSTVQRALLDNSRQKVEDFLAEHLQEPDLDIEICIRVGVIDHQLLECAQACHPNIVCMGTVGRAGLRGFFAGNTAERMIIDLKSSLLVTHH